MSFKYALGITKWEVRTSWIQFEFDLLFAIKFLFAIHLLHNTCETGRNRWQEQEVYILRWFSTSLHNFLFLQAMVGGKKGKVNPSPSLCVSLCFVFVAVFPFLVSNVVHICNLCCFFCSLQVSLLCVSIWPNALSGPLYKSLFSFPSLLLCSVCVC